MAPPRPPWIIRAFMEYRGPEEFYVWSPGDSQGGYGSRAMRITVEAQKSCYEIDTAPLVNFERYLSRADDIEQIRTEITDIYLLLRARGEPWYKIEAIPSQIYASAEVKEVVGRSLRLARDVERATIFKRCFPQVDCDKRSMGPLEELGFLIKAGYEKFPLSILRERRCEESVDIPSLQRRDDVDPSTLYKEHNISVPIDYFHNDTKYEPHSNGTFPLRYWFDASYYKDGGPVIVLQGGETDAVGRLPYLQKGIVHKLAQATNGIGVILEHRYYGASFPTPDLSTANLRFLTTDQALADMAYFAQNVVFEGLEDKCLTAPNTAYFGYGGSYAGAFVAFLRVLYPDVYYGTISSSGVTEAIWDFWRYYEPVREYGPPDCIDKQTKLINVVDNILLHNTKYTALLKRAFDMETITYDDDFAQVLSDPIGGWQGRNWDPDLNDPSFYEYCSNLTSPTLVSNTTTTPNTTALVQTLLAAGGYAHETATLTTPMLNFITYIQQNYILPILAAANTSTSSSALDQAYSNHNQTFYAQHDLAQSLWRSWPYQYCTQWGYLQTGSGVPASRLPLISRLLTLDYNSLVCRYAFNITAPPDTAAINRHGGYNISYDRLAIVDGQQDPWRGASPHSVGFAPNRTSSVERPFLLIEGAVHHWDENGRFANETTAVLPPRPVREVQADEVAFVKAWLQEFRAARQEL
ncbi:MAG: hypothetical protein LQ352_002555 [Teloschistes flavicans]|nr:MAG: hypothetical protein LQ352_002555 [Teloschistes flavicans]